MSNEMKILIESFKSFITENTLHVRKGMFGTTYADDDGTEYELSDIVKDLLDSGYNSWHQNPVKSERIDLELKADGAYFPEVLDTHDVSIEEVTRAFANLKGLEFDFQYVEDD